MDKQTTTVSSRTQTHVVALFKRHWALTCVGVLIALVCFVLSGKVSSSDTAETLKIASMLIVVSISVGYLAIASERARKGFWIDYANKIGWTYIGNRPLMGETSLLLLQGSNPRVTNALSGSILDMPAELFEYYYEIGTGKHKASYNWTIFELKTRGTFPHLYLNTKRNGGDVLLSKRLRLPQLALPTEAAETFELFVPKEYEIEALAIFSPEVLAYLLDLGWKHDLELADGEIIICRPNQFNSTEELEAEMVLIKKVLEYLAPRLHRQKLAPIGDLPHRL